jgi:hypothetical protein
VLYIVITCFCLLLKILKFIKTKDSLPRVFVPVVVDVPDGAVGLVQGVVPLHNITVAVLVLALDVTAVVVLHLVLELIFGMSLLHERIALTYAYLFYSNRSIIALFGRYITSRQNVIKYG